MLDWRLLPEYPLVIEVGGQLYGPFDSCTALNDIELRVYRLTNIMPIEALHKKRLSRKVTLDDRDLPAARSNSGRS